VTRAIDVANDRVVDDELCRGERVDLVRVAAEIDDGLTHRCKVDDTRNTGEVLHDDTSGSELNLRIGFSAWIPSTERRDVLGGHVRTVFGAKQVLEQHLQAVREPLSAFHLIDVEDLKALAVDVKRGSRIKTIE